METEGFTFHAFITPPADRLKEYHTTNGSSKDPETGEMVRTGDTEYNWYNWNSKNWHTKWNACSVDITRHEGDDPCLIIGFETAWSPPEPVFDAMAEMFPSLDFDIEFEEEQGWGGTMVYHAGEVVSISEWDIPDSHADYMERNRSCEMCQGSWGEDPNDWYDDCPDKKEEIENLNKKETVNV